MEGKPGARALRRGRYSSPNQVYLITTVTRERRQVFQDLFAARLLVRAMRREQEGEHAFTLAYVIMPDHLHWLMMLGETHSLSRVVRSVKAVTAHALAAPLWQAGFHDHALRYEEDLATVARYVVSNPLRAGLVDHVGDYPHWDAIWL